MFFNAAEFVDTSDVLRNVEDAAQRQLAITLNEMGVDLFKAHDYGAAVAYFAEALKWYNMGEVHINRADALLKMQRFEDALTACDDAEVRFDVRETLLVDSKYLSVCFFL